MKQIRLFLFVLTAAAVMAAHGEPVFTLGKHYERITPQQPTESADKVEVVEVFWYGCRHCSDFEPFLEAWLAKKPEDVSFRRMPGIFAKNWIPHARAFFAAEILGVTELIHKPLFDAVHARKRPLKDEASLAEFFAEHGVSEDDFRNAFNSFTVDNEVRQAIKSSRGYGISGVPSMIVNGKYRSSARLAGDFDDLLKVVDHLVDTEQAR
jgi:thiol:disulfide interchange protein DsbA